MDQNKQILANRDTTSTQHDHLPDTELLRITSTDRTHGPEQISQSTNHHAIQDAKDWSGPDDPGNPRNFSLKRRAIQTASVSFLAFVSTFAGSVYAPAHAHVSMEFNVSDEVSLLPLSIYSLGMAFGPIVGAPLSETFGRQFVLLVTTPVFGAFIVGSALSKTIVSLCICRFFAGVFASPAVSNGSATIVDFMGGKWRAISLAFYYAIPFFGAVSGPLVGGLIDQRRGWRWTQWTTLILIVAFGLPVLFTRETYKKTILQRRAKKLDLEGPPAVQRTLIQSIRYFFTVLIARPVHMLLTETIVTLVCMYNGFMFGLMYTFVVASPWVFEHEYNFDTTAQSLSFLGLIIGTATAPIPMILIDLNMYQPRLKRFQALQEQQQQQRDNTNNNLATTATAYLFPPENRLFPGMTASFILPASLFIFAWTSRPSVHWIIPIIFQSISIQAALLIYASSAMFMMDAYGPLYGASAAGAAMLSRYSLSAAFPLFALQMYQALGVGWATTILGLCALMMAPIPWCFWWWGERLRARTKYETSS